jgi:conjugative relaxase-like TrwC/TraI family protein
MIRMIQSTSASHAKSYFTEALSKSDYYINDQELQGSMRGRLAERLGINGPATKDVFFALCENRHPKTVDKLTPRTKDQRTIGYDINYHVPKSVSIIHSLSKDNHILNAFQEAVQGTMIDIEADARTRVRQKGKQADRGTGELVWAEFIHQTARPVDGHAPDPHLHAHCFVMNATFDSTEGKIKAAKLRQVKRDMPYYQACFQKRLADKLVDLGYEIKRTDTAFEVVGVPQEVINYFSKRTDEIGRVAKEKGITSKKELDALGAKTRSKKQKGLSMAELKTTWKEDIQKLNVEYNFPDRPIRYAKQTNKDKLTPSQCIDFATRHYFERASVVTDRKLLAAANQFAIGQSSVSVKDLHHAFTNDSRFIFIQQGEQKLCTTKEVLTEEKRMVELARKGIGSVMPLSFKTLALDNALNEQQKGAITHILTTTNRVSIVRGAAGTGKTRMMQQAVHCIEDAGKTVTVIAPTAEASRGVLKSEGFEDAETVAHFLNNTDLQDRIKGQVVWVDEAGLLGTKDMAALLAITDKQNARLILGGDTRQHASVVRGDALRILNTVGGIKSAELSHIQRQKKADYRKAVEDLSNGNIASGFKRLDDMNSIVQIDRMTPHKQICNDYIEAIRKKKSALIVSPTHKDGDGVTQEIRKTLKQHGKIGKKEIKALRYQNASFTEAQKTDWRNYIPGQVIQFNQNVPGLKRGSVWKVKTIENASVFLEDEQSQVRTLPRYKAKCFDVFNASDIGISKGDKIRITRNGFDKKEKRLNNGMTLDVKKVTAKGQVLLSNPTSKAEFLIDKDFGHIAHAHCITSHASQGKTVDEVLIYQPASTFGATNAKQFYVSVSRGRGNVIVYTDDKEELLEHAMEQGDRQSAIELVDSKTRHEKIVMQNRQKDYQPAAKTIQPKSPDKSLDRDYEPTL